MSWIVETQKEGDDVIVPLPQELLDKLEWKEGDELHLDVRDNAIHVVNVSKLTANSEEWENGTLGCSEAHVAVVPPEVELRIKASLEGVNLDLTNN